MESRLSCTNPSISVVNVDFSMLAVASRQTLAEPMTSLLRQNELMSPFLLNNYVIITLSVRGDVTRIAHHLLQGRSSSYWPHHNRSHEWYGGSLYQQHSTHHIVIDFYVNNRNRKCLIDMYIYRYMRDGFWVTAVLCLHLLWIVSEDCEGSSEISIVP